MGQKFCQNRSISHCFRDKCVFAFYTEIQDGRQKWRKNYFWEKLQVDSTDTLLVKNLALAGSLMISRHLYNKPTCQISCKHMNCFLSHVTSLIS